MKLLPGKYFTLRHVGCFGMETAFKNTSVLIGFNIVGVYDLFINIEKQI